MAIAFNKYEGIGTAVAPIFDGYTVDFMRELGHGAFGTVYQGWNRHSCPVAVKKISREEDGKAVEEALKLQHLKNNIGWHDHIITIHDVKYWMGAIWIAMEQCDLGDLDKYFKKNAQSQDIASKVDIMKYTMNGLAYLHSQNMVHRDIKPANILVMSTPKGLNIKLADFGLCKILGADESTMSSNVGTLLFKAPEFWDEMSNNRVHYHRTIDVYAAGLTFTAMLQAIPGMNMIPKAEGSLQASEANKLIGLAVYNRKVNNQPDINLVVDKPTDDIVTRQVKTIIRGMTHVSPQKRLSAQDVEDNLHAMFHGVHLTGSYFLNPENGIENQAVCTAGNQIIIRCYSTAFGQCSFRAFNIFNGKCVSTWPIPCPHYPPVGSLVPFGKYGELVLEACPACAMIRVHNVMTQKVTVACSGLAIRYMCSGPYETLLAVTNEGNKLLQLLQPESQVDRVIFAHSAMLNIDMQSVSGLEYFPHCDTVVLARTSKLQGIKLSTEQLIWQWDGSIGNIPLSPRSVSISFPGAWACVANGNNVLVFEPSDGSFCEKMLHDEDVQSALWFHKTFMTKGDSGEIAIYQVSNQYSDFEYPTRPQSQETWK